MSPFHLMPKFRELENNLTDSYLELKKAIFSSETFWLRQSHDPVTQQPTEDYMWFSHPIIARPLPPETPYSVVRSSLTDLCTKVLVEILLHNNIKIECFHRICINLLTQQPEPRESEVHIDHSFDYRHIIIYLDDSDGDTIMYNSKHRIVDRSSPEEDKVILFGKCQHSGEFPIKHPKRTILVATFS